MNKMILTAAAVATLSMTSFAAPAFADGEEEASAGPWSATLAVTSDYRFRGVTQTDRNPAVQGSIDFASETGFFAGVWASNIDFLDDLTYDSSIEVDLYAGYTHAFSDSTEGTIKVTYYAYPDADTPPGFEDYNYFEAAASLSHTFGWATISAEVAYSPDYFAGTGDAIATTGGLEVALCKDCGFFDGGIAASGHVGYQWIDNNIAYGLPDYLFYDLGLSATVSIVTFDARWVGTDIDDAQCYAGSDWCEGGFVGTVSLALGG